MVDRAHCKLAQLSHAESLQSADSFRSDATTAADHSPRHTGEQVPRPLVAETAAPCLWLVASCRVNPVELSRALTAAVTQR